MAGVCGAPGSGGFATFHHGTHGHFLREVLSKGHLKKTLVFFWGGKSVGKYVGRHLFMVQKENAPRLVEEFPESLQGVKQELGFVTPP